MCVPYVCALGFKYQVASITPGGHAALIPTIPTQYIRLDTFGIDDYGELYCSLFTRAYDLPSAFVLIADSRHVKLG